MVLWLLRNVGFYRSFLQFYVLRNSNNMNNKRVFWRSALIVYKSKKIGYPLFGTEVTYKFAASLQSSFE